MSNSILFGRTSFDCIYNYVITVFKSIFAYLSNRSRYCNSL